MSPIPRILLAVAAVLALSGGTRSPARADTEVPADLSERAGDLMKLPVAVTAIDDLVLRASGIGNVFLGKTPGGNVVYDTGVPWQGAEQREQLLAARDDGAAWALPRERWLHEVRQALREQEWRVAAKRRSGVAGIAMSCTP